jgi:hypothetical protein
VRYCGDDASPQLVSTNIKRRRREHIAVVLDTVLLSSVSALHVLCSGVFVQTALLVASELARMEHSQCISASVDQSTQDEKVHAW